MPSTETFTIKPIRELVSRYIDAGEWIDPFCRNRKVAMQLDLAAA